MRTPADGRGGSTPPRPSAARQAAAVIHAAALAVRRHRRGSWLLRAAPRPAQSLPGEPWARAYGLLPAPGGSPHTIPLIGPGLHFGPQYAMGTDLDEPLIIASVTADGTGRPARCSSTAATARTRPPGSAGSSCRLSC